MGNQTIEQKPFCSVGNQTIEQKPFCSVGNQTIEQKPFCSVGNQTIEQKPFCSVGNQTIEQKPFCSVGNQTIEQKPFCSVGNQTIEQKPFCSVGNQTIEQNLFCCGQLNNLPFLRIRGILLISSIFQLLKIATAVLFILEHPVQKKLSNNRGINWTEWKRSSVHSERYKQGNTSRPCLHFYCTFQ